MNNNRDLTLQVKELAVGMGFARVGIAHAGAISHTAGLESWLNAGMHAGMEYMNRNLAKRMSPKLLVPGTTSIICLALSYAPRDASDGDNLIAAFARGRDYHKILKRRCRELCGKINELGRDFKSRIFVDTAPVMERSLAISAGLGWLGQNGCLIVPGLGSYVVLCEIFTNLPLIPDMPIEGDCGQCGECLRACPAGAISASGLVDANKCISYQTIENRQDIPADIRELTGGCVFGCDACQRVCPHNQNTPPGDDELLSRRKNEADASREEPQPPANAWTLDKILRWTYDDWDLATRGTPIRRATYPMFMRNAILAAGNSGDKSLLDLLRNFPCPSPQVRELVGLAIEKLSD